jgi:hypothetical protein
MEGHLDGEQTEKGLKQSQVIFYLIKSYLVLDCLLRVSIKFSLLTWKELNKLQKIYLLIIIRLLLSILVLCEKDAWEI